MRLKGGFARNQCLASISVSMPRPTNSAISLYSSTSLSFEEIEMIRQYRVRESYRFR